MIEFGSEHDFSLGDDGLWWCDQCNVPSDFCGDEERCACGCVCNVGDPDLRERHVGVYYGAYGYELEQGMVTEREVLAMALHSAKHELEEL